MKAIQGMERLGCRRGAWSGEAKVKERYGALEHWRFGKGRV